MYPWQVIDVQTEMDGTPDGSLGIPVPMIDVMDHSKPLNMSHCHFDKLNIVF